MVKDFITRLLESHVFNQKEMETIFKNAEELFDEYLNVSTIKDKRSQMILYSDIVSIEIRDSESIISTKNNSYLSMIRQESMLKIAENLNFQKCDKSTYVNMSKLKKINSILGVVLFENVSCIKEAKERGCTIIYIHNRYTTLLKDFLGIENDLSYKLELSKSNKEIFRRNFLDELP